MGLIINPRQIIKDGITSLRDVWSSSKVSTELSGKQATLVSGTNIKTINNTSLLGSGDITISGGGDIPRIEMTATTATLDPNKFYVWGEVASLDISLAAETAGIENIYKFQFQSGDVATNLALFGNINWYGDIPSLKKTTYIVSVQSNIAKIERLYKNANVPANFQEVEYLQADSQSYIDTLHYLKTYSDEVTITWMATKNGVGWGQCYFGAYGYTNGYGSYAGGIRANGQNKVFYGQRSNESFSPVIHLNEKHTTHVLHDDWFLDDASLISFASTPVQTTPYTCALFKSPTSYSGDTNYPFDGLRIYYFKVKREGDDYLTMYPCYCLEEVVNAVGVTIPANTAGMYDIVEGKFYTNAGSGSFIVGPDV